MLRVLATRMVVSGFMGGAAVRSVTDTQATPADHQLLYGVLAMVGAIGAAAVTGYFTLLVSRGRSSRPVTYEEHEQLAGAAKEANDDLVQQLVVVASELQRKEAVIARQGADAAERDAIIDGLRVTVTQLNKRLAHLEKPPPRRRRAPVPED